MVVKSIATDARASATGVAFYQKAQQTGAFLRPEKILFLGNYQTGKTVENNVIYSGSGNADDVGTMFGFGSPLHRMALKAYSSGRNGTNVETYFLPIPEVQNGTKHKVELSVSGTAKRNATLYLRIKEQLYEAAADVVSKVAPIAHGNPALDPKGTKLNIFNYEKVPFTLKKGDAVKEILGNIKEQLEEYVEVPFIPTIVDNATAKPAKILSTENVDCTTLTAEDYYVAYSVDSGETKEIAIGSVLAETAGDVIELLTSSLSGVTITADNAENATSAYTLTSLTSGPTSKLEILTPTTGTDLFAALNLSGIAEGASTTVLELEAKVKGDSAKFDIDIVNSEYRPVSEDDYGVMFKSSVTSEGAGLIKLNDYLENISEELGVTRVCSQFNDDNAIDTMKEYFQAWHNTMIAQYVLCYTAKEFPENKLNKGTVDIDSLVKYGNSRRDDNINVQIFGDYGNLRPLKWEQRNKLLKSGISNLEPLSDGGFQIGDLCTFYHSKSNQKELYMYDRDICCIGNVAYYLMQVFKYDPEWKSVIVVGENDKTTNPKAKRVKSFIDKLNNCLVALGEAAILANVNQSTGYTIGEIDSTNPDRINLNNSSELSSINRIVDIGTILGFNYGG